MAERSSPRNSFIWACCGLATVGLAHGVIWLTAVNHLEAIVERQAQILRGHGWRVAVEHVQKGGWPGRARLEAGPASISGDSLSWRAGQLRVETPLRWPGATSSPVEVRPDHVQVEFGSSGALDVTSRDLKIEFSAGTAALVGTEVGVPGRFIVQALQLRLGPGSLALAAQRLKFLDAKESVPEVDSVALQATLISPGKPSQDVQSAIQASREAARTIDLPELTMTMGRARITGHGRFWIDEAFQPRLDSMMSVTNYAAELDALSMARMISEPQAVAIKAVLGMLAAPSRDDRATVPMQVKNSILTVAGFPLLSMPALNHVALTP